MDPPSKARADGLVSLNSLRVVLRARCEHFRALCNSGMRDADATEVHVPEDLSEVGLDSFSSLDSDSELQHR